MFFFDISDIFYVFFNFLWGKLVKTLSREGLDQLAHSTIQGRATRRRRFFIARHRCRRVVVAVHNLLPPVVCHPAHKVYPRRTILFISSALLPRGARRAVSGDSRRL